MYEYKVFGSTHSAEIEFFLNEMSEEGYEFVSHSTTWNGAAQRSQVIVRKKKVTH